MNKLFTAADRYLQDSDWKTIAVLKFCLIALGMMLGMAVPRERRKPFLIGAAVVFVATYVPLMVKLVRILMEVVGEDEAD